MARILLVEDDEMIARMLTLRLRMQGHEISLAVNGAEGVELALKEPFDIVLMDMHMPVMDGHEATRALRVGDYSGLIVAVTASAMAIESRAAMNSGCDAVIVKPIGPDFEQRIATLLEGQGVDSSD